MFFEAKIVGHVFFLPLLHLGRSRQLDEDEDEDYDDEYFIISYASPDIQQAQPFI